MFAVLAFVAVLALPASAGAYVYWGNEATNSIGRAALDGSGANQAFVAGASQPTGIATDGSHVYWANQETDTISRANLDGSDRIPNFITGAKNPQGVAVDGDHIYWVNAETNAIGRANLNGTSVSQTFITTGLSNGRGLAVDGAHIYWANFSASSSIGRANLDGGGVNQNFIIGTSFPWGVAVDGSHVYWANEQNDTIGRANLNGSGVSQSFITGAADKIFGLAVDGSHIYWANYDSDSIGRANLDGSGATRDFIPGASNPDYLTVDALPYVSTVTLACDPAQLTLPGSASCTATVSAAVGVPGGTVSFASSGAGSFGSGASCALAANGATQAACQVAFTPSAIGTQTISASYAGELSHAAGAATAQLTAKPSNAFQVGKPKLNPKNGTASLTATVPGPGKLALKGGGVKKLGKAAKRAGKVKLVVKPAGKSIAALQDKGKAKVTVKVTFTPNGGDPRTRSIRLTLKLAG